MTVPSDCIEVVHGKMVLAVPKDIFSGRDAVIDEEKAKQFAEKTKTRYPWVTDNAMEVIMRNARKEMLRLNDERTGGRSTSKRLESEGKTEMAIQHKFLFWSACFALVWQEYIYGLLIQIEIFLV